MSIFLAPSSGSAPGGSSTQVQFNSSGSFGGISTLTYDGSILATSGRFTNSYNATASAPAQAFTGSWFTGGTGTTTKPQVLIEPSGTTSTAWSTSGTGLGVNAPSGFVGNLLDLQVNGTSNLKYDASNRKLHFGPGSYAYLNVDSDGYVVTLSNRYGSTYVFRDSFQLPAVNALIELGNISSRISVDPPSTKTDAAYGRAALNTNNPTNSGWLWGKYGGAYAASTGFTQGTGWSVWCGYGAQPTDTNANGGNAGNFDIWLNAGGAGKGTGSAGANGKMRIINDANDTEVFSIEQTGIIQLGGARTVANLPASPTVGMIARVTDATAPAVGSTVSGGGSAAALAWYNGINWTVLGV